LYRSIYALFQQFVLSGEAVLGASLFLELFHEIRGKLRQIKEEIGLRGLVVSFLPHHLFLKGADKIDLQIAQEIEKRRGTRGAKDRTHLKGGKMDGRSLIQAFGATLRRFVRRNF